MLPPHTLPGCAEAFFIGSKKQMGIRLPVPRIAIFSLFIKELYKQMVKFSDCVHKGECTMFSSIKEDIRAIKERDPAARTSFEVLTLYPGLHALLLHRPAHWLYKQRAFFSARLLSQFSRFLTGIEIHPGAKIGRGVLIDHGSGVVIGETAEVGNNCTIYQGVTLGGTGKDTGKRHPTIGNNVLIGSGAKVLGPFKIGDGSKIASNAVVLQPLPPYSTAVGVPARIVRRNGKKVRDPRAEVQRQLDHVRTPDPVSQELCRLSVEVKRLKKRLAQIEAGTEPQKSTDAKVAASPEIKATEVTKENTR